MTNSNVETSQVRGAGSFWPVRDYHWGTCEAFSTQHSDCTYLKRLLLEVRGLTHAFGVPQHHSMRLQPDLTPHPPAHHLPIHPRPI